MEHTLYHRQILINSTAENCNSRVVNQTVQNVELMQLNGRRVLAPPENWTGPPPSSDCELFVRRIPNNIDERKFLAAFLRFGCVYEVRLPVNFQQGNRGYAYIKYANENDALCAMEVLNHYYISRHHRLEILRSYDKSSLYITNLPRNLSEAEIEKKLRTIFPNMQRIIFGNGRNPNPFNSNYFLNDNFDYRRHAFIEFPTHNMALEAKRSVTAGVIRIWDRDLKVVWANVNTYDDIALSRTLLIRNINIPINARHIIRMFSEHVPRSLIRHVTRVNSSIYVNFSTHESAEIAFEALHGRLMNGKSLCIEWASKPADNNSQPKNMDFDSILRLKCLANGWGIPIIIFGRYYETEGVQYGAIVLRRYNVDVKAVICIMNCIDLMDIHSRMCEVACNLIENIGGFPDYNYVFYVQNDTAKLLGMVMYDIYRINFLPSYRAEDNLYFDLYEIFDMSSAISSLCYSTEETILLEYLNSFKTGAENSYMLNWPMVPYRIFGTIMPKYRNMPNLRHNLNDTQIVLALCFKASGSNATIPGRPYHPILVRACGNGDPCFPYIALKLFPVDPVPYRNGSLHELSHILFGGTDYYHPAQRMMKPPLLITGCSYNTSVKYIQTYIKLDQAAVANYNNRTTLTPMPISNAIPNATRQFPNGQQHHQCPGLLRVRQRNVSLWSTNTSNGEWNEAVSFTNFQLLGCLNRSAQ